MARRLALGEEAPNFDLSSTEGSVLMLRDEVPRNLVVLYFFADPAAPAARNDLAALAATRDELARQRVNILGVSPAKMPELKALQLELGLPFPLLHDDRNFSHAYGIEAPAEGSPSPALILVGRDQTVRWIANPVSGVAEALAGLRAAIDPKASPTSNYPSKVINRLVDRWVN
jgi:peroxiredoxin